MTKPDLTTVLQRRRRTLEQFFTTKIESGMSKEDILSDVTNSFSLSDDANKVLEELIVKSKKVAKEVKTNKVDTKTDETKMSDDNVTTNESQAEESKKEVVTEDKPTKRKKRKTDDNQEENNDSEEE